MTSYSCWVGKFVVAQRESQSRQPAGGGKHRVDGDVTNRPLLDSSEIVELDAGRASTEETLPGGLKNQ